MNGTMHPNDHFADYSIVECFGGNIAATRYLVRNNKKDFCLRVFKGFNFFDPMSLSNIGYKIKTENSSGLLPEEWIERFTDSTNPKWIPVHEEEEELIQYFENRLSITEELNGLPGFPRLVSAGVYNGYLYFVTNWEKGNNLKQRINSGYLTVEDKLRALHQSVSRLEQMHGLNLLHNDVKPSNYFVTKDGVIILCDFDLSLRGERKLVGGKYVLQHNAPKGGVGSLAYMSPEITELSLGLGFTEFSDLYSLGVTGYQLLGGKFPFRAHSVSEYFKLIRKSTPSPVASLLSPNFPQRERVSDLVHWPLKKSWHKRPRAIDFRRELEGILTEEGIDWNEPLDIKVA